MKKWLAGGLVAAVAVVAFAQTSGSALLNSFTKALQDAEGLNVTYSVTKLGGASESFTVNLAKPNLARIDSSSQTIVADGTHITFFDKKSNQYFKRKQTDAELRALFAADEFRLWTPFFIESAFKGVNAKGMPDKARKGTTFKVVALSAPDSDAVTWTLYVDPSDNVVRQAEIVAKTGKDEGTRVIDCKSLELSRADVFAFKAPSGSKEVDESELYTDRWYTDWDEALAMAKKTNRAMFVDFYTDWCHWCKVLDKEVFPTAEFRAMSKYFVFVKINAEVRTDLASRYNVSAYPTAKVISNEGAEIDSIVGFKKAPEYVAAMKSAAQKAGFNVN